MTIPPCQQPAVERLLHTLPLPVIRPEEDLLHDFSETVRRLRDALWICTGVKSFQTSEVNLRESRVNPLENSHYMLLFGGKLESCCARIAGFEVFRIGNTHGLEISN